MNDITGILKALEQGDRLAAEQLLPLVYNELRELAAQKLRHEAPGQTLQSTALVHEAYLRLVVSPRQGSGDAQPRWDGRNHFFAAAAEAMRRILVENVRRKRSFKRGGDRVREELDEAQLVTAEPCEDLLALDEALDRLTAVAPVKAELVKLRYFAGLTGEQAAQTLGISVATAERYWSYARAWLHQEMTGAPRPTEG
jgi:RNA polymerase sigma factor (TIGR02999 family)